MITDKDVSCTVIKIYVNAKQKRTAQQDEQNYGLVVECDVHFCIFVKAVLKNYENIISEI